MVFTCACGDQEPEKTFRILLLGNVASGKTTFCKQVVDAYLGGFSESMKKEYRKHIQANIVHRLVSLLKFKEVEAVMKKDEEFQRHASSLESAAIADFEYTDPLTFSYLEEVLDAAVYVGRTPEVRKVIATIFFTAPWDFSYFDSIERIMSSNYQPSSTDIFICRKPTAGVCEYVIKHLIPNESGSPQKGGSSMHTECWIVLSDVGGARAQRNRWEQCLQDCDGIFYFMSMTDYASSNVNTATDDYYSYLNDECNMSLDYSGELLMRIFKTKQTSEIPFILVLTKKDLFIDMIKNDKFPMQDLLGDKYTGPSKDPMAAQEFFTNTVLAKVKGQLVGNNLWKKLDKMPIIHMDLTQSGNFIDCFSKIWERMEYMLGEMAKLRPSLQLDVKQGRMKNFSFVNHKSFFRSGSNPESLMKRMGSGKKKTGGKETDSNNHLLRKPSFDTNSSTAALISGDEVTPSKSKSRRMSAKLLQGIRRTKSYHWN